MENLYDLERFVEFDDHGRLAGVLHLPLQSSWPCPVVIYCPGKNGERSEVHRMSVKLARTLARHGIACLRFDYYGVGTSDGMFHEVTTNKKVSNVLSAAEYLMSLDMIQKDLVALVGFSDGARVALLVSSLFPVCGIVFWSPVFLEFGGDMPFGKVPRFFRHPSSHQNLVMPWAGLWVGMDFYRDLASVDVVAALRNYNRPSIVLYSNDDPIVEEQFTKCDLTNSCIFQQDSLHEIHSLTTGGHLFCSEQDEQYVILNTVNWLQTLFKL